MTTAPILKLPIIGQRFYLLTDASRQAISYTLAQKNGDGIICPVLYGARSLSRSEALFTLSEMLAILEGLKKYLTLIANVEVIVL